MGTGLISFQTLLQVQRNVLALFAVRAIGLWQFARLDRLGVTTIEAKQPTRIAALNGMQMFRQFRRAGHTAQRASTSFCAH